MHKTPRANINLVNIKENARILKDECDKRGINITGVVKGSAGDLRVINSVVEGGITTLGDSRIKNIIKMREAGFENEMVLLRLPRLSEIKQLIKYVDISLNSELVTLESIGRAALKKEKLHKVIIMVDVGDLREGVLVKDFMDFMEDALDIEGIKIIGLGTNVGCYGGVLPTYDNTKILLDLKEQVKEKYGYDLEVVSGGNTATTILFEEDELPTGVNNLRVGEGLIQGTDVTHQREIPFLNSNNITLTAEIIELKDKPSIPTGQIGHDAFGNKPKFEDKGIRKRAILAVGRQDVKVEGMTPLIEGVEIIGASSDHLLCDVTDSRQDLQIGSEIEFKLNYGAMLKAMTSEYVNKKYISSV
ncbi:MAG TPA: alanine/ornithine racemase family PLP-dependent enzyme [Halanaerobiales bacterium]|nr:alanine/ornithine racemase family PLP-dependent enzyme [Halanaerobiales bacterium]